MEIFNFCKILGEKFHAVSLKINEIDQCSFFYFIITIFSPQFHNWALYCELSFKNHSTSVFWETLPQAMAMTFFPFDINVFL